ncbi:hypothetical protein ABVT39_024183, partial [Epinephelus coioides]
AVQPHQCQAPAPWRRAAAVGRLGLRSLIGARGRLPLLLQLCCRWLTVGSKPRDLPGVRGRLVAAQHAGPEEDSAVTAGGSGSAVLQSA